jgi:hypothetical protein
MNNYVYQLIDPRTNSPFYIGEGKGTRAWSHQIFKSGCNNPHKDRVIEKIHKCGLEVIVGILYTNLSKHQSELLEEQTIKDIGLDNLTNITANAHPPIKYGQENGFHGKTHTDQNKQKCGDANRGKDTKTTQGRSAISESMTKRWQDPEQRERQIQHLKDRKGEKRSDNAIESYKQGAAKRNATMTPEQRTARTLAGCDTKKIKYAGLKRQRYTDDTGKIRFRWIPAID